MVSVIIPCYNQAHYLAEAVLSARVQSYSPVEIIVVNDGSTDNTEELALRLPVKYVSQPNRGLSAARNKGIDVSTGDYLVFLDADDWFFTVDALQTNYDYLQKHPEAAFVSGGHHKMIRDSLSFIRESDSIVRKDHYLHLLQGNYIGMHGAVMYRRSVFNEFRFDESLRACEDYDLYLKIARKYPVVHHTEKIAVYRRHENNMSADIEMMLATVTKVLQRQELRSEAEKRAQKRGLKIWKAYYKPPFDLKSFIKKNAPAFMLRSLHKAGLYKYYNPVPGKVNTGDLKRLAPFSSEFGYDRGGPVDRYYIENFLKQNAHFIKGRVLEIGDNYYTTTFGGDKVEQSDVLHIDSPKATFTGDLSNAPFLPNDSFDCIVLTQTLHLIYDFKAALQTCYRVLKPGGCLLLTVPGITPIDHGEWKKTWYWSFTKFAMAKLMQECFPGNFTVDSFGNLFVATAFLYGMGLPEVDKSMLDQTDEHYQVIITVAAIK